VLITFPSRFIVPANSPVTIEAPSPSAVTPRPCSARLICESEPIFFAHINCPLPSIFETNASEFPPKLEPVDRFIFPNQAVPPNPPVKTTPSFWTDMELFPYVVSSNAPPTFLTHTKSPSFVSFVIKISWL